MKITTTYDKTLKGKVFVLKGEEGYARTTDVLADVISDFDDCNTHIKYSRIGLEIEVLRNFGKGFVNIYNDDRLLMTVPYDSENMDKVINQSEWYSKGVRWTDNKLIIGTNDNTDSGLFLDYNTDHHLKVRFMGNQYCLASVSEVLDVYVDEPDAYQSTLTVSSRANWDRGDNVSVSVRLDVDVADSAKTIKVYDNDSEIDQFNILANQYLTWRNKLSDGLHNLRFVFMGDDEATYSEASVTVSVGYIVSLTSVPSYFIRWMDKGNSIGVNVVDYYGNPATGTVSVASREETLDKFGNATIDFGRDPSKSIDSIVIVGSYIHDGAKYYSDDFDDNGYVEMSIVDITGLNLTTDKTMISTGYNANVVAQITPPLPNVPVIINDSYSNEYKEYYTDENGRVNFLVTGYASGDRNITAECGQTYQGVNIEDVYQYASSTTNINSNIRQRTSSKYFTKVSNGFKLYTEQAGQFVGCFVEQSELEKDINWEIEFLVRSKTNGAYVGVGYGKSNAPLTYYKVRSTKNMSNTNIRVTYINHTMTMYVNETLEHTITDSSQNPYGYPTIVTGNSGASATMIFDNVKVKRL